MSVRREELPAILDSNAVARKLVAYMLAVDRRKQDFVPAEELAAKAVA